MVREVWIGAGYGFAACQILGFEIDAVGRQNEFGPRLGCRGTVLQRPESLRDAALVAGGDVDIASLENATEVGLVRRPGAQPLDRRLLVAEGFQKGIREVRSIKWLFYELRNGLFDFDSVQRANSPRTYTLAQADPGILANIFGNPKDTERMGKLSNIQRFARKDASFFYTMFRQARFPAMPPGLQQVLGPVLLQICSDDSEDQAVRSADLTADADGVQILSHVFVHGCFCDGQFCLVTSQTTQDTDAIVEAGLDNDDILRA